MGGVTCALTAEERSKAASDLKAAEQAPDCAAFLVDALRERRQAWKAKA
jgi:hypothetical protein